MQGNPGVTNDKSFVFGVTEWGTPGTGKANHKGHPFDCAQGRLRSTRESKLSA